jgi:hypothetical protein
MVVFVVQLVISSSIVIVQTDSMDQPVKVIMTIYIIDLLSTIQARLIYEQYYSVCW